MTNRSSKITPAQRLRAYIKCGFQCVGCGVKPPQGVPDPYDPRYSIYWEVTRRNGTKTLHGLDIDHIVPYSLGGRNNDDNLQVLCTACNNKKGARLNWRSPLQLAANDGA